MKGGLPFKRPRVKRTINVAGSHARRGPERAKRRSVVSARVRIDTRKNSSVTAERRERAR